MSCSNDPDHFFQTSNSIAETSRKAIKSSNNHGTPIRLSSKILAVATDPTSSNNIYAAESAGVVRKIALDKPDRSTVYRGPTAPITSLTFIPTNPTLFAGCWDKTIYSWSLTTHAPLHRYIGHSDFVKCIICICLQNTNFLISGSADASIILWSITGSKLHVLKGHTRGIQHLAIDPTTYDFSGNGKDVVVFSAGSDREIRRWLVTPTSASQIAPAEPIIEHETSVYKLRFDADDDLWTASADGTVKCLVRERGWKPDTILQHPDFVRDVIVTSNWVITACRDEGVRVWDKSTGNLYHTFIGHYEEVTALALINHTIASVSIDGTIRRWSLAPSALEKARSEAADAEKGEVKEEVVPVEQLMVTEEEERELADLMGESD